MLKIVENRDEWKAGEELLLLDEIAREGARRMLIEALKAEVDDYVERHRGERDEQGHALVVRNGRAPTRKVTLGAGTVELRAPRVNDRRRDKDSHRQRFTSHILPPYMRRSPKVAEVLPISNVSNCQMLWIASA
jgi:putative transposase